jgi:acetylornithine deacetylase
VDPDRADALALARALVAVPSVNPDLWPDGTPEATGEGRIAELVARWLRGWGFRVETVEPAPGRTSVVARAGSGRPRTILNGHLDTVGVEGMTVDPFDPVVRHGRLFGRGSCDMKAGIGAILAAARNAARAGTLTGEVVVALTADEEHASLGLRHLLDGGLEGDRAIVAEPTSLALHVANKGFCWVHVVVHGRAAHGSRPDLGRDAIRHAGRILAALDRYDEEIRGTTPHPLLGLPSIHAGTIRGGTAPSVYPARCELVLEARTLPGEGPEEVMARLDATVLARPAEAGEGERAFEGSAGGASSSPVGRPPGPRRPSSPEPGRPSPPGVEVRAGLHRPGGEIAPDAPLAVELARACRAEGLEPKVEGMSAWVESAWFVEAGIPALCFGPGSIELAHCGDESVPVEEIHLAARILERFLSGEGAVLDAGEGYGARGRAT